MALVRTADPQLASMASVPSVRPGDLSAFVQGFGPEAIFSPTLSPAGDPLRPVLAETRPDGDSAHRFLPRSRRSPTTLPPGSLPVPHDELCARVLATLGEALGWTYGAVLAS